MATSQMTAFIRHLRGAALAQDGAGMTDGQLLESFIGQKDEAAFEALLHRHGPMVLGVCRRILHNPHDAEDAFQATFLVFARKASSVRPRERIANWLHGVAHRTALKARTMQAKKQTREKQLAPMPEPVAAATDPWNDLQPVLDEELGKLPETFRLPLMLCDVEGKSIKEATQQLGWPQGTLAGRLARGRKMLAKRLTRRGVVLSAGSLAVVLSEKAAAACVSPSLAIATVQAAVAIAAGKTLATSVISAKVAALTEGVLQAMFLSKLKTVTAVLLVLAMATLGGGALAHRVVAETADEPLLCLAATPNNDQPPAQEAPQFPAAPEPGEMVMAVRFGSTGEWMVTAEMDGKVRLWNTKTQRPGPILRGSGKMVRSVAFTPDSATVVAGSDDGKIYVWDVRSGKLRTTLEGHSGWVCSVAIASDGATLASSARNFEREAPVCRELKIWDLARGKLVRDIDCTDDLSAGGARGLVFAPSTQLLAAAYTGKPGGIKVWDAATGNEVKRFTYDEGFPLALAISPNGKWLASGGGDAIPTSPTSSRIIGNLKVWDWASGKLHKTLVENAGDYFRAVVFSKDSTRLVAGTAGPQVVRNNVTCVSSVVQCWEAKQWTRLWTVHGLYGGVFSLDISPDGQRVVSSDDSGTSVIDAVLGRFQGCLMTTPHRVSTEEFGAGRVLRRPDWTDGTANAVDLKSRVYSLWANGSEDFYYRGKAQAVNEALRKYTDVKGGVRQLVLLPGAGKAQTLSGKPEAFDWRLQAPGGLAEALFKTKDVTMTVYISALKPRPVDRQQFDKWLRDLNSDSFPTRAAATAELQKLGNDAKPLLNAALAAKPTVEMRRRIESLLDKLPSFDLADLEIPKGVVVISVGDLVAKGIQELKDPNRNVRSLAMQDLSRLARFSDKVVPTLVEIFEKDKDVHMRQIAAICLGQAGAQAKPAASALKQGLHDPDANIRHTCQNVLNRLANAVDAPDQPERIRRERAILKEINELRKATDGND
jgi:RNA polymerase sigma factor (sigma-70 family)